MNKKKISKFSLFWTEKNIPKLIYFIVQKINLVEMSSKGIILMVL